MNLKKFIKAAVSSSSKQDCRCQLPLHTFSFVNLISFSIYFLLLTISISAYSQCCEMGSVCGASNTGIINKQTLRATISYRYGYFDTYYYHDIKLINYGIIKNMYYNYTSAVLGYGITNRIIVEDETNYFINKVQHFNDTIRERLAKQGHGFSNGVILVKYGLYIKPANQTEITLGGGIKYPFTTKALVVDNVRLPLEVQPSIRAFGFVGMFFIKKGFSNIGLNFILNNRYDINLENPDKYTTGSLNTTTLQISKKIAKNVIGIIQIRNEYKQTDKSRIPNDVLLTHGSELIYCTPTLTFYIYDKWIMSVYGDIPIYKYYRNEVDYSIGSGGQISNKYAFGISLTRDFNLKKK